MVFSSIVFLFAFLPAVLVLYFVLAPGRGAKNAVLLIASLLFYAWGGLHLLPLLIYSIVSNYFFGRMVTHPATKQRWMRGAVVSNIGVLVSFKYVSFLSETLHMVLPAIPLIHIALPVGISFYTFQGLSYVIDVYRGDVPCEKNLANVALYIALFPQLVAGPIVRYATDQVSARKGRRCLRRTSTDAPGAGEKSADRGSDWSAGRHRFFAGCAVSVHRYGMAGPACVQLPDLL